MYGDWNRCGPSPSAAFVGSARVSHVRFAVSGLALLLALLVATSSAWAGHYRLSGDLGLLKPGESAGLRDAGIKTTHALLDATASKSARRATAKSSGLSYARLGELAAQCDLLRLRGVGPSAVLLLQRAGVQHSGSLARQAAVALHSKVKRAQEGRGSAGVVPGVPELSDWIGQAKRLPKVLEGIR